MVVDVLVPALGESVGSATVARWLKRPGDQVLADEPIVELDTDKASVEVPCPVTGRLEGILAEPGDEVATGQVVARIGGVEEGTLVSGATASTQIEIVKFFEAEAKRHADLFAAAQTRAADARAALPGLKAEVAAAKAALDDKLALKQRAEQEGLDTVKLDGPIAELRGRMEDASTRLTACEAQIEAGKPGARPTFEGAIALARSVRDELHVREAVEIAELRDCYPYVIVKVASEDATGQPTAIDVGFGRAPRLRLRVRHAQPRVSSKFRPKALEWVPESPESDSNEPDTVGAFIDRARCTLVLPSRYLREVGIFGSDCRELRHADLAVSLEDHLQETLGDVGTLDLDHTYPGNELAEIVRVKALALTAASGPFRPTDARLTSGEVAARIKDDWGAFVSCPWAADVTGAMALLKYHAENGEKPRLWCEGHEGHYGFRLRTRDHTWLVGELFVTPDLPPPNGREPLAVAQSRGSGVARLGRLHLKVEERR